MESRLPCTSLLIHLPSGSSHEQRCLALKWRRETGDAQVSSPPAALAESSLSEPQINVGRIKAIIFESLSSLISSFCEEAEEVADKGHVEEEKGENAAQNYRQRAKDDLIVLYDLTLVLTPEGDVASYYTSGYHNSVLMESGKSIQDMRGILKKGIKHYALLINDWTEESPKERLFLLDKDPVPFELLMIDHKRTALFLVQAPPLPPPFQISILGAKTKMDAFGKEYTSYDMKVSNGTLEWMLSKRYTDFINLQTKLKSGENNHEDIDISLLPALPARKLYHSEDVIQERQTKLDKYLNDLISMPKAMENINILSFLGLMSSVRSESAVVGPPGETAKKRQIMHLCTLTKSVDSGDIILFRCAHIYAGLQRAVTRGEWDHVALVVDRGYGTGLDLLESTGDGVTCYPLMTRMSAYATEFTSYIAIRRLQGQRTPLLKERLRDFARRVNGKPYGFSVDKLFSSKYRPSSDNNTNGLSMILGKMKISRSSTPKSSSSTENDKKRDEIDNEKGFFCSQLVAAGLQHMGVLRSEYNYSYFYPNSFSDEGEIDKALVDGYHYSATILLDTKVLEVGTAVRRKS